MVQVLVFALRMSSGVARRLVHVKHNNFVVVDEIIKLAVVEPKFMSYPA